MFDRILNRPLQCEEKCGIDLLVAFAVRKNGLNGRRTVLTYLTFTCSKSTIKTLEKDKKYVQS